MVDAMRFTGDALKYVVEHGHNVKCVMCGVALQKVYVVPTVHGKNAYGITLTFSCPDHRSGVAAAFVERVLGESRSCGVLTVDEGLGQGESA